ncbi:condensation domain-containing protein, partial [Paraburkholderia unamae]
MQSTSLAHATLLHLLRNLAAPHSDFANCTAFTYLSDGESISSEVTYAQLDDAARRLAARIQEHTNKGDRVLLVFPSCFEYVVAFYACVYAGVIAVPTVSAANTRTLDRLRSMVDDARPALALTLDAVLQSPDRSAATTGAHDFLRDLKWLATDAPHTGSIAEWNEPALTPDDVVFLQYTSGSTGTPKGVEVTHAALLANARLCRDVYGLKEGDVFVSWVPPYHDFGLIGAIVVPVFVRGHSVQFPPASFLRRPYRWLKLISDFRARITGAPNFAYQLCAKRVSQEEKQTLDLGCLELAINGAERVRAETVRSFQEAFGSAGLRSHVMTPAYGMAESVLLVTANMNKHMDLPPAIRTLDRTALERGVVNDAPAGSEALEAVLTGSARTFDHRVAIVDPATMTRLPENRVGEIWVQGPSVARGYWGKYQESEATFSARLTQESGTWLRSGDLGFVDSQGLYVTGRMKEVMNFGGRKLYPQDVELTIERLDEAFRPNGCATFSLEDGPATQLVVIQEVESHKQPTTNELIPRLRSALAERHEIFDVAAVLLVRPGTVPRTSSGKIQRLRCSELFRQQSIKSIWSWSLAQEASQQDVHTQDEPSTSTARTLLSIWQEAFHNNNITVSDNFFHLGGHSLQAAQMIARIQAQFCVDLPLHIIFRAPTPVALAREIDTAKAGSPSLPPIEASHLTPQHMPLSFAQQRFWFLNQYQPGNAFYNVPCVLEIDGAVDTAKLEMALNALAARHQPLRTQFRMFAGEPEQVILDKVEVPLLLVDLLGQDDAVVASRIEEEARREVQRPFDLSLAPLLRATLIRRSPTAHVLLLTAHHIVCDGWSIAVMLRDLSALYGASGNAGAAPVAPLRVQFSDVVSWERRHFDGAWLGMRTSFWTRYLDGAPQLLELATDRARTPTPRQHGAAVTDHLPRTLAGALTELGSAHHATLFMTMVAAMNALLFRLTGQHDFCTGIMSANRPQGTEALVGNFINVMPLRSRIDGAMPYAELLRSNANDLFLTYEHQIPFEHLMRSVLPDDSGRRQAHRSHYTPYLQLVLNFHNELDIDQADLNWAGESGLKVAGRHPADVRHAAFEIKVEIQRVGDGLRLVFEYDTELFDREAVEQLARHYRVILEAVAAEPQRRIGDL